MANHLTFSRYIEVLRNSFYSDAEDIDFVQSGSAAKVGHSIYIFIFINMSEHSTEDQWLGGEEDEKQNKKPHRPFKP